MKNSNKPNKLIIWDFDGVIADSEHLWVKNWVEALHNLKHIDLDDKQTEYYIRGKADKTKEDLLQKDYPDLTFDNEFLQTLKANEIRLIASELFITPDVENIFKDNNFTHCIATGATAEKNALKIRQLGLEKYFTEQNMFTAYDVKHGKPAPDLFLYAAAQMGYSPQNSVIIEDSLAGICAGCAAGIPVIAYIGATGNNSAEYAECCRAEGAEYVVDTMPKVYDILQKFFYI
ncbi:MAG: HAD family phosphatase [Alphaproteobacteria bacterium]|nr:HAD family phosphatase [Alphaproteobacteria bacterium]